MYLVKYGFNTYMLRITASPLRLCLVVYFFVHALRTIRGLLVLFASLH